MMRAEKSYVIFGIGKFGRSVAEELTAAGMHVLAIDKDEDKNKDKDKNKDENEKSYIGIFVEKECGYLSKNIMQFGADMKVVWPDNVKNEVVNRLKGMLSLYE